MCFHSSPHHSSPAPPTSAARPCRDKQWEQRNEAERRGDVYTYAAAPAPELSQVWHKSNFGEGLADSPPHKDDRRSAAGAAAAVQDDSAGEREREKGREKEGEREGEGMVAGDAHTEAAAGAEAGARTGEHAERDDGGDEARLEAEEAALLREDELIVSFRKADSYLETVAYPYTLEELDAKKRLFTKNRVNFADVGM